MRAIFVDDVRDKKNELISKSVIVTAFTYDIARQKLSFHVMGENCSGVITIQEESYKDLSRIFDLIFKIPRGLELSNTPGIKLLKEPYGIA